MIDSSGKDIFKRLRTVLRRIFLPAVFPLFASPLAAHPHVFVDGGVNFVVNDKGQLEALQVTWLYDAFETLYILSSYEMSLKATGTLDEADRQRLVRLRSDWPADFDGSSHISMAGARVALDRPRDMDAQLVDGRLKMTFTRHLRTPVDMKDASLEVAVYEATYFYAFAVTDDPLLLGETAGCDTDVIPFNPDTQDKVLQATLAKLGREETPDIEGVGAFFADRIVLKCA
jgi:ABC-type uncharacterized transport system substrate-binding protein